MRFKPSRLAISGKACELGKSTIFRITQSVMPKPKMAGTILVAPTSSP